MFEINKKTRSFQISLTEIRQKAPLTLKCRLLLHNLAEKDVNTYVHSCFTGQLAAVLGAALELSEKTVVDLYIAGLLHDLGKILVPRSILLKEAALTGEEYAIVRQHVDDGIRMLSYQQLSATVVNAIKYHHERWDGKGYPHGLDGRQTPIEGRILQIADAFSAMTTKRAYRDPLSTEEAVEEIRRNRSSQFDPELADLFIEACQKSPAHFTASEAVFPL
ncbi:metal-dependent phosphohydrolase [Thermacetogenium phaeum DSM 12270]|uniref:Metal-dependent phosphohydrolase n=1 Tax=Thermacetogenium phaeum (strain ATCC BAA-254 / DSM 26808 / PB) TaxID=1089553 RepID=K4LEV7_THEPS|nr:HD-GYP domain-containing protein [Thermacetogenium phaeum]AFV10627.1 metal-dependent phosphohydrolase [Thermacetogenium phaeum DSM 12270]